MASAQTRIRWDRLGRWALLFVLALVVYLYVGRDDLRRASSLEREARRLGMVKAGERAYIVEGLPPRSR
jgi:hypothetical protein